MNARNNTHITVLTLGERTTANERITGHVTRTTAHRRQTAQITIGSGAASTVARILADAIETGRSPGRTITVAIAFGPTFRVRTANVSFGTFADGSMVLDACTLGTGSALATRRCAPEIFAHFLGATFTVRFAFVSTAAQRTAGETGQTRARRHLIDHFAFGILAARCRMACLVRIRPGAIVERIPLVAGRATAYGHMVSNLFVSN